MKRKRAGTKRKWESENGEILTEIPRESVLQDTYRVGTEEKTTSRTPTGYAGRKNRETLTGDIESWQIPV